MEGSITCRNFAAFCPPVWKVCSSHIVDHFSNFGRYFWHKTSLKPPTNLAASSHHSVFHPPFPRSSTPQTPWTHPRSAATLPRYIPSARRRWCRSSAQQRLSPRFHGKNLPYPTWESKGNKNKITYLDVPLEVRIKGLGEWPTYPWNILGFRVITVITYWS